MAIKVRAIQQGFYKGQRIRPGKEFEVESKKEVGRWMEIVEPEKGGKGKSQKAEGDKSKTGKGKSQKAEGDKSNTEGTDAEGQQAQGDEAQGQKAEGEASADLV